MRALADRRGKKGGKGESTKRNAPYEHEGRHETAREGEAGILFHMQ